MIYAELTFYQVFGIVLACLLVIGIGVFAFFEFKKYRKEVKEAEEKREEYKKLKASRKKK